jgi:hypothetical protein
MAPERKPHSSIAKFIQQNASELENPHFDTKMPPSLPIYPEIRKKTERSLNVVHGTLYRKRSTPEWRFETSAFVQTLREWTIAPTVKVPERLVQTAPISVVSDPDREVSDEPRFEALDTRPVGPHLAVRCTSDT